MQSQVLPVWEEGTLVPAGGMPLGTGSRQETPQRVCHNHLCQIARGSRPAAGYEALRDSPTFGWNDASSSASFLRYETVIVSPDVGYITLAARKPHQSSVDRFLMGTDADAKQGCDASRHLALQRGQALPCEEGSPKPTVPTASAC